MEETRLAGLMPIPFGGILRMAGWLNGVAALLLTGASLIVEDIATSDLRLPLLTFLIGVLACGVSGIFSYWVDMKVRCRLLPDGTRRGPWLLVSLATMACLVSLTAFATGCWLAMDAGEDSAAVNTTTVFGQGSPGDRWAPRDLGKHCRVEKT